MPERPRRLTDEEYAEMAADYEANPIRADEVISIEFGAGYYCAACGCPANEHDEDGVCHAIDFQEFGKVNDCICPGLVTQPPSQPGDSN